MATKIEERVGVPLPQDQVWELLADLEGWKDWNPLHPRVEGKLGINAPIRLEQRLEGRPVETVEGVVADWVPYEQIHIARTHARGWARSVRYMEIEPLTATSCIFSVGEVFGGFLGDRIAKKERRALRAGFLAMGEALREAAVQRAAGAPAASAPEPEPAVETVEAASAKKKTLLKPIPLNQYAPKPLGMKPLGGVKAPGSK
ncbi:MAG: SRPBCC domain-containing protein [Caulobacterales bacterium]|nr:SRPBCC domain-containing protein [Caulobacterales bacterium]